MVSKLAPYKASKELEAFLCEHCGPYFVCNEGTCMGDLEALLRWKAEHGEARYQVPIPVYPYSEDSPFSPEADAAYQAWHDRLHAEGEYAFDMAGELELASYQLGLAHHAGLAEEDCWALFYHVYARVLYHYFHNGSDPVNRAEFITACFLYGCQAAARGEHEEQYANRHC